ncbi:MAG: GIY-YIG nuclease family protein [Verrucomicrobia bacterium]|nr:GIY-YIG nuclease family protein [Verrucomicrobiota bacterium]
MKRAGACWVYVLECGDGSFYTGWTNDLPRRVRTHQAGKGGKYTRSRLPVRLIRKWDRGDEEGGTI